MNNKRTIIMLAVIAIAAVVGFLVYKNQKPVDNTVAFTLRVPNTKFMGLLPLYVADERGYFAENKIKIEWVDVKDPGQAEKIFLSGHADLNGTTFANLLQVEIREPGTLSLFIPTYESADKPGSYFLVSANSPIQSIADLKGKKIGTYAGPSQKAYAQIALTKIGLTVDKDYELIQVASSSQIQSLFGGVFDVLFTVEPYGSVALQKGARKLEDGVRTKYIQNPFWVGAFEVKKEFAKDTIRMNQIVSSMNKAIQFIKTNEGDARKILSKRTTIDTTVAANCFLYNWITTPSDKDVIEMQGLVKKLVDAKFLEKEVDINTMLYKKQ
ncbi:MAG: ABC transporter substrate-binding protein [bacterium]|nr:ABC transporter substrate-binding protein [bacterium]